MSFVASVRRTHLAILKGSTALLLFVHCHAWKYSEIYDLILKYDLIYAVSDYKFLLLITLK